MARLKTAAIAVLLMGMANDVSALDLTKWKHQAQVIIEDDKTEYCKLILIPEVYDAARPDLGDIRLIGANGQQIPYVLVKPKDTTEKIKYNPGLINCSQNEGGAAMVTLDFKKKVLKNSIEVQTSGNNFRRAVKVEGSNDNVKFFMLVEHAFVFAVDDTKGKRFEQVDLPVNDYRYLRITVEPMADEEESPIIKEVRAFEIEKKLAKRQPVNMTNIEHSEDEKTNSSIYVYDLGYRQLPASEIILDVADDSFYRYVTIEGRDEATRKVKIHSEDNRERFRQVEEPWKTIVSNTIYRYNTAVNQRKEKLVLRIPSDRHVYKQLKITIKNYDDRPLTVNSASAEMIAHNVVFEAENNAAPTLYVGSKSATKPRYDLTCRLNNPGRIEAGAAHLGRIVDNPLFGQAAEKQAAWTEKHKVLLLAALGIIVLVLFGLILKSLKSIQSEQIQK